MLREQGRKVEENVVILQIISELQRKNQYDLGASHRVRKISLGQGKQEERIDGADGSKSRKRHRLASEDTMRGGTPLSTSKGCKITHGQHSNASTKRHNHHRIRREKEHMPKEFKNAKPPTFDGEVKKA